MKIQIPLIASYLMQCAMIVMGVYSIHVHDWLWMFASFSGFILSMAPNIIEKRFDIRIPLLLDLAITLVLFFHVGGGVLKMYWTIPFYDKIGIKGMGCSSDQIINPLRPELNRVLDRHDTVVLAE
jgi:hypothetical protein